MYAKLLFCIFYSCIFIAFYDVMYLINLCYSFEHNWQTAKITIISNFYGNHFRHSYLLGIDNTLSTKVFIN